MSRTSASDSTYARATSTASFAKHSLELCCRHVATHNYLPREARPILYPPRALGRTGEPFVEPARDSSAIGNAAGEQVGDLVEENALDRSVGVGSDSGWEKYQDVAGWFGEAGDPGWCLLGSNGVFRDQHNADRRPGIFHADQAHYPAEPIHVEIANVPGDALQLPGSLDNKLEGSCGLCSRNRGNAQDQHRGRDEEMRPRATHRNAFTALCLTPALMLTSSTSKLKTIAK